MILTNAEVCECMPYPLGTVGGAITLIGVVILAQFLRGHPQRDEAYQS